MASSNESLLVECVQNQCVSLGTYEASKAGVPSAFSLCLVAGTVERTQKPPCTAEPQNGRSVHFWNTAWKAVCSPGRNTCAGLFQGRAISFTTSSHLGIWGLFVPSASVTLQGNTGGNYDFWAPMMNWTCTGCFMRFTSFNSQINLHLGDPQRFCRSGNEDQKRLRNLPKVSRLIMWENQDLNLSIYKAPWTFHFALLQVKDRWSDLALDYKIILMHFICLNIFSLKGEQKLYMCSPYFLCDR